MILSSGIAQLQPWDVSRVFVLTAKDADADGNSDSWGQNTNIGVGRAQSACAEEVAIKIKDGQGIRSTNPLNRMAKPLLDAKNPSLVTRNKHIRITMIDRIFLFVVPQIRHVYLNLTIDISTRNS